MKDQSHDNENLGQKIVHNIEDQASAASNKVRKMSSDAGVAITGKVEQLVHDFNAAIPAMKTLGFSVKSFTIGVGLLPELDATLEGDVDALDPTKIQGLIDAHADNKALVAILEGLQTAAKFKEQLTAMGIKGVEMDIKLGFPPLVTIDLLT